MAELIKKAKWITCQKKTEGENACFTRYFDVDKKVKSATAYASAIGVYELRINGVKQGRSVLTPGLTSYKTRVQYQSYDITGALTDGQNRVCIEVGPGWAVGVYTYCKNHNVADHTSIIGAIEITYEDKSKQVILTDECWETKTTPVVYSDIYNGETVDMTAPVTALGKAKIDKVKSKLVYQIGEDIIEQERLAPVEYFVTPKGEKVIDFGQNMTGYVELKISGKKGDVIEFDCAEVLDKEGNFYNANYRSSKSTVKYVLDGVERVYKPRFSFQGFRYIRFINIPSDFDLNLDNIRAIAVNSDIERTGYFRCGDERINQLFHNIIWGQKSNYLDIPTDCPQRDERLGWTGDAQVFCATAARNFKVDKFFKKWLGDLRIDQYPNVVINHICPMLIGGGNASAAWADACTIIPWELYRAYNDVSFLEDNFEMMKKYVDYLHSAGSEEFLWLEGSHYGDWLAMDAGEDSYVGATSVDLIASAFFAYSTELLIKSGKVLGKDMSEYESLYASVRARFREFYMYDGKLHNILPKDEKGERKEGILTQTGIILVLKFNLCEESERAYFAGELKRLIAENNGKMTTGFVGTPYILDVLTKEGMVDEAYKLLYRNDNPSWLYSVDHGATTMWEHWNGIKEDGSFWSTDMNSFNHYAYGSVGEWLYGTVCGVKIVGPGYKEIEIAPIPCKKLGFAQCSIDTVSGTVKSGWYYKGDDVYFDFVIPCGVTAKITLPNGKTEIVRCGSYCYTVKA